MPEQFLLVAGLLCFAALIAVMIANEIAYWRDN